MTQKKKAVLEAGKELEPFFLDLANGILDKTKEEFKNKGVQIHDMSENDFNKWFELANETAYKTYVERAENGQQLLDLALDVK